MSGNAVVVIEDFATSHFLKSFAKKYKHHWDVTLDAIIAELTRIEALLQTDKATIISETETIKIIKTQFRVVGTKESAKTSGNRTIVAWHTEEHRVSVLLVYSKTDLASKNETAAWQKLITEHYPEYSNIL
ncbi:MAG: hypothetical protein RLZZ360_61 [Candidatus Parcubacteria bacterium]|jgi:hypothetical protein